MKKNINKEVLAGLTKLSEENSLFGYLAAKRMYRADCVCHLVKLPFDFKKMVIQHCLHLGHCLYTCSKNFPETFPIPISPEGKAPSLEGREPRKGISLPTISPEDESPHFQAAQTADSLPDPT